MQYKLSQYFALAFVTFIFVGALTPLMRKFALRIGAVDAPNLARKVQKEPVPYLGGVAIIITILSGIVFGSFFIGFTKAILMNLFTIGNDINL